MKETKYNLNRRTFLEWSSLVFLSSCTAFRNVPGNEKQVNDDTHILFNKDLRPFYHGVASGDPLKDAVIIWTRITPEYKGKLKVGWEVSTDENFTDIDQNGIVSTSTDKDYTVKIDVKKLVPDTYYYYRFRYDGIYSVTGRTKTLPAGNVKEVNLVAVNCNAYEGGHFNAYSRIADKQDKIDAVLHLGDYIYEDFLEKYFEVKTRIPLPKRRCISLADYRTRYAQYRLDKNLQAAHMKHPFINIWDDHEIANDAYKDGANAHDPLRDGEFAIRKRNAIRSFHEWLPTRTNDKYCNRKFEFGELITLFMLDERTGRTIEEKAGDPDFNSPDRKILNTHQYHWLTDNLKSSEARWNIIGNQVLFSKFDFSMVQPDRKNRKLDDWSGYPNQRDRLISFFDEEEINNIVFLSGDSHCSWAFNVVNPEQNPALPIPGTVAVEIGIPAISSGTWGDSHPQDTVIEWEKSLLAAEKNKHLKYVNLRNHGYVQLKVTADEARSEWYSIDKHDPDSSDEKLSKQIFIRNNIPGIYTT